MIYCLLDLEVVSVMLYPCMLVLPCQWICLFVCCVLDSVCELLVKQFAICLGVFVILLLNVMELLEVLYWIDHVWSSI